MDYTLFHTFARMTVHNKFWCFLRHTYWQIITMIVVALVWGASFLFIKKGLVTFSANDTMAIRLVLTSLFLVPVMCLYWKRLNKKHILPLVLSAILGNSLPQLLYTIAQQHIPSSLAGMLNSMMPLFALIWAITLFGEKVKTIHVVGLLVGFVGVIGLAFKDSLHFEQSYVFGFVLIIFANVCYGIIINIVKKRLHDLDGLSIVAFTFMFLGPLAAGYMCCVDVSHYVYNPHFTMSLVSIGLMSLLGNVLAASVFNILMKFVSTVFAAATMYIVPVFAIMWGSFDGEHIVFIQLVWTLVVLLGVYLVNRH